MEPYPYGNLPPIHPNQFNYSCLLFCLLSSLEFTDNWPPRVWTLDQLRIHTVARHHLIWTGNNPCCLWYHSLVIHWSTTNNVQNETGLPPSCNLAAIYCICPDFNDFLKLPRFGGKTQSNHRYDRLSRFVCVLKSCLGNFFHCST